MSPFQDLELSKGEKITHSDAKTFETEDKMPNLEFPIFRVVEHAFET